MISARLLCLLGCWALAFAFLAPWAQAQQAASVAAAEMSCCGGSSTDANEDGRDCQCLPTKCGDCVGAFVAVPMMFQTAAVWVHPAGGERFAVVQIAAASRTEAPLTPPPNGRAG